MAQAPLRNCCESGKRPDRPGPDIEKHLSNAARGEFDASSVRRHLYQIDKVTLNRVCLMRDLVEIFKAIPCERRAPGMDMSVMDILVLLGENMEHETFEDTTAVRDAVNAMAGSGEASHV